MATIRELRVSRDWSQRKLAEETGVSAPAIHRLENGKPIRRDTFLAVCTVLGVIPEIVTGVSIYSAVQSAAKRRRRS